MLLFKLFQPFRSEVDAFVLEFALNVRLFKTNDVVS